MPQKIEPIKRIVVALSGPPINLRVVREAVRLATLLKAELHAVHMRFPKAGDLTLMMEPLPLYTEEDLRNRFREAGCEDVADSVSIEIIEGTNPAKMLAGVVEETDLIVLGHRFRNRILAALSSPPVQLHLLEVVNCPVVVVPKPDGE